MRDERCKSCKFFGRVTHSRGFTPMGNPERSCNRFPPSGTRGWPEVGESDWCGEYAPAKARGVTRGRIAAWVFDNIPVPPRFAPYLFGMIVGRWPQKISDKIGRASV